MTATTLRPGHRALVPLAVVPHGPGALGAPGAVPCAARPSTGFLHLDGPCRCFFGGPAPEFAPMPLLPGAP